MNGRDPLGLLVYVTVLVIVVLLFLRVLDQI